MCLLMAKADNARTSGSQVSAWGGDGYFTRPKPCLPPKSCIPSTILPLHRFKPRGADHCILRDDLRELLLGPTNRRGWLYRQHHVAVIGRGVPDSDLGRGWKVEAHFTQDRTGLPDHARSIVDILVPVRCGADEGIGSAGAQRADDHIVDIRRVLEHDQLAMVLGELEAHLFCRRPAVGEHARAKCG